MSENPVTVKWSKVSLKDKLTKLVSNSPKSLIEKSQYIFNGLKSPVDQSLVYAILLSYFSETTPNKNNFKSYRTRLAQQQKHVCEFINMVDLVVSKISILIKQSLNLLIPCFITQMTLITQRS